MKLRFSMRTALWIVTIAAVAAGWVADRHKLLSKLQKANDDLYVIQSNALYRVGESELRADRESKRADQAEAALKAASK